MSEKESADVPSPAALQEDFNIFIIKKPEYTYTYYYISSYNIHPFHLSSNFTIYSIHIVCVSHKRKCERTVEKIHSQANDIA